VRVAGHDRDDASRLGPLAELRDQWLRVLQVTEHTVAQDGRESFASDRFFGALAVSLHEGDPLQRFGGQLLETLAGFVQHRWRRVEDRDVISRLGERE
jgi:hypothetical protein